MTICWLTQYFTWTPTSNIEVFREEPSTTTWQLDPWSQHPVHCSGIYLREAAKKSIHSFVHIQWSSQTLALQVTQHQTVWHLQLRQIAIQPLRCWQLHKQCLCTCTCARRSARARATCTPGSLCGPWWLGSLCLLPLQKLEILMEWAQRWSSSQPLCPTCWGWERVGVVVVGGALCSKYSTMCRLFH